MHTAEARGGIWRDARGAVRPPWRLLLWAVAFLAIAILLDQALPDPVLPFKMTLAVQGLLGLLAAWSAGALLLRWVDRRPVDDMGFGLSRAAPRDLALGLAIGAGALALGVALLVVGGLVRYAGDDGTAGAWLGTIAADLGALAPAAAAEEAIFRGYPFQALVAWMGALPATLLASAGFAAAHAWNPNVGTLALLNIFLAGVLLSVAYLRTGSLWFASGVHLGWNWMMASVLDLPVSGLTWFDTPLYEPRARAGWDWATGGAFGPEAGVAATLAAGAGLAAIMRFAPRRTAVGVEDRG